MCAEPVNLDKIFGFTSTDSYVQYDLSGKNHRSQDQRGYYPHSKHGTLNASSTESKTGVIEPVQKAERGKPIYEVKDGQISIKGKNYPIKLPDGYYIIRKLTVNECKRLQTVPEWYDFSAISNSQAYKCLGNGWTCDVITHLIKATQVAARRKWLDDLLGGCL
jgi:site-specific DNA-cytosine methylase